MEISFFDIIHLFIEISLSDISTMFIRISLFDFSHVFIELNFFSHSLLFSCFILHLLSFKYYFIYKKIYVPLFLHRSLKPTLTSLSYICQNLRQKKTPIS